VAKSCSSLAAPGASERSLGARSIDLLPGPRLIGYVAAVDASDEEVRGCWPRRARSDTPRFRFRSSREGWVIRVGIGGWVFAPWRGVLYPPGLPQAKELAHASRQVTAIEINGTFYGRQKPESFRRWHDETHDDFVFSVKGPRFVTHRRELATAGPSIGRFFESGVLELRRKLGPILWQFAPFLRFDETDFDDFLALLPAEIEGRPLRHVVEVRHSSFTGPEFTALLQRHRVAVALVDDEKYPAIDAVTGDFVYARLRRSSLDEPAGYASSALDGWAERARGWAKAGLDAFIYFIDGAKIRAPAAAAALLARLATTAD
jgi:uncharacterized protein YecE (DUF72 family)